MVCGRMVNGGCMTGCRNGIIRASAMREKNGERMQDRGVWSHAPRVWSVVRKEYLYDLGPIIFILPSHRIV